MGVVKNTGGGGGGEQYQQYLQRIYKNLLPNMLCFRIWTHVYLVSEIFFFSFTCNKTNLHAFFQKCDCVALKMTILFIFNDK